MSQELLALLGEKELALKRLSVDHAALQEKHTQLEQFVIQAARDGRPLELQQVTIDPTEAISVPFAPLAESVAESTPQSELG